LHFRENLRENFRYFRKENGNIRCNPMNNFCLNLGGSELLKINAPNRCESLLKSLSILFLLRSSKTGVTVALRQASTETALVTKCIH
jgi:hypothetical protein